MTTQQDPEATVFLIPYRSEGCELCQRLILLISEAMTAHHSDQTREGSDHPRLSETTRLALLNVMTFAMRRHDHDGEAASSS